ncbi:MAG: MFS transporter [Hyphomonadaceae bacterium]
MSEHSIWRDPVGRLALAMSFLFCGAGVLMPFLALWLKETRGLSGVEIGAVASAAALARIFVGPLIAAWADGFADRRTPIRIISIAALIGYAAFFNAHGFPALLALGFAAASMTQAVTPLIEGGALRASQYARIPFGAARALSSILFMFGNVVGGALVAQAGPGVVAIWFLTCLLLTALSAWFALKPDPAPQEAAALGFRGRLRLGAKLFTIRRFTLVLVGAGLIQAAHAFYYNFSVLVWRGQGISDFETGLLWAFAVIVEIALLAALPQIEKRFGPETLLILGGAAALVRWSAFALAPIGWILWPLQALHALSFAAAHVGALRIVMREAPEAVQGLAQTLYAAMASGVLIGLASLGSGYLYDHAGAAGYWAMAAIAALGLVLVATLRQR